MLKRCLFLTEIASGSIGRKCISVRTSKNADELKEDINEINSVWIGIEDAIHYTDVVILTPTLTRYCLT